MGKLRVTYRGDLNLEVPDLNSYDVLNACQKLEIEKKAGLWSETNLTDLATYNKILNDKYGLAVPAFTGRCRSSA